MDHAIKCFPVGRRLENLLFFVLPVNHVATLIAESGVALTATVLVCTAGRGDSLVPTVRSILAADGKSRCDELLVIDQSLDDRTGMAIAPFLNDPRLRYTRSATRGKTISMNMGIEMAKGEIIACTDDDVDVRADWLEGHLDTFERYPQVALTYGQVLPVEYDATLGFIPDYPFEKDRHLHSIWDKLQARGIGANIALRRSVIQKLGGFDVTLGPGGKFFSCEDGDMTLRCLISGYQVYEVSQSRVYHYGFRTWEQGRKLAQEAWYGIGAAYSKPLKCGHWNAAVIPLHEFFFHALLPMVWSLFRGNPQGWIRVKSFVQGFVAGWRTPVDKSTLLFRVK